VVLALSVAVVAGYIEVYVEGGPDLDGLHIYAWDGREWTPVHVIYVPEYIHTYITATGQWTPMPYYNMSRYILHIPSEALTHNPPDTPPGLDKWTLEVQNKTRKTVVELAVGKTPITKGNLTLSTWYSLGDQPPKTPHRGKFINPPRSPPKNNAAKEADTASRAVSPGTTIYPIGSLYFKPVKVSGSFNTYMPVDTPIGYNTICAGLPEMHWVGFEVLNLTIGVKVSGTIHQGTLTLEFYNLDTCTLITTYTTPSPSSGRWANIDVPLPRDSQIGVRIRVDGYAPYDATIDVYVAARYVKTVNNLAQIATSKSNGGCRSQRQLQPPRQNCRILRPLCGLRRLGGRRRRRLPRLHLRAAAFGETPLDKTVLPVACGLLLCQRNSLHTTFHRPHHPLPSQQLLQIRRHIRRPPAMG